MKKHMIRFIYLLLALTPFIAYTQDIRNQKIILINPSGDSKRTGRKFPTNYERAITFKIAEALQKNLEQRYGMRVIQTRVPGEEIVPLQNASFANRLNVNTFLNINVYKEETEKPKIYLYHRVVDPIVDLAKRSFQPLTLLKVNQAHIRNIHTTKSFGERIKMVLTIPDYQPLFDFYGVYGLPIKPLEGITSPAFLLEIGLNDEEKWPALIEPLTTSLKFLLDY